MLVLIWMQLRAVGRLEGCLRAAFQGEQDCPKR